MTPVFNFLKCLPYRQVPKGIPKHASSHHSQAIRAYADKPKSESNKIAIKKGTENEQRLHVRRTRPSDVPRVLRFVRTHARAWPGPRTHSASPLVLGDYVARALGQGHSMVAEQQQRRGVSQIRGLALGTAVVSWDAALLERFARCIKCPRSRRFIQFTAHCLRAPALHHKYNVHKILQVVLIVPFGTSNNAEVIQGLVKISLQRGREIGLPLVRFDVTCDHVVKVLEEMKLKKEWQLIYQVQPESADNMIVLEEKSIGADDGKSDDVHKDVAGNFIAVYTGVIDKKL